MNNLKRILSLALASVMVLGMMVVGASAAEFKDSDEIAAGYVNAVETMNALGIINGFEDGSFRPEDTLTRAQMAMMLATIFRNGRTDFSFAVKAKPSFTDVKSTDWFAGAVEYATNMKIINGRGNGIFDPNSTVTGIEAARMILNAMGYEQGEGDWQLNTVLQAEDVGLYNKVGKVADADQTAAKLTRQAAAQMLCNAMDCDMAGTSTQKVSVAITEKKWVIALKDSHDYTEGTVKTIDDMNELGFDSYNDAKAWMADNAADANNASMGTKYEIKQDDVVVGTGTKDEPETLGHKYLSVTKSTDYVKNVTYIPTGANKGYTLTLNNGDTFTKLGTDYSNLMGQKVRVMYKGTNKSSVYGVVALGTVLHEGVYGDLRIANAKTIVIAGKAYASDNGATAPIYNFNKFNVASPKKETPVKVIDNDGDGAIDMIVATPITVEEVRNVSATRITLTSGSKLIDEEIVKLDGIKTGDYVLVTTGDYTVSGMIELAATETVEGDCTAVRTGNDISVGGNWYKQAGQALVTGSVPTAGTKGVTLIMVNGYYVGVKNASTASKDMLIITKAAGSVNSTTFTNTLECQVLFLKDGTTATVKVSNIKTGSTTTAISAASDVTADSLYNYTVKDGLYTLEAATTATTGYGAALSNNVALNKATISGNIIADDAVILVKYDTGATAKYSLLDGKTVKAWAYTGSSIKTVASTAKTGFVDTVANVDYVKVAVLTTSDARLPNSTGVNTNYAWVMSTPIQYTESTADGNVSYYSYTLWNGTETLTVKDRHQPGTDIVTYVDNNDGTISSTDIANLKTMAVTGIALGDNIVYLTENGVAKSPYNLTKDTVALYIDTDNWEGVASGAISMAEAVESSADGTPIAYVHNVYVVPNATTATNIDLIVVDVYNDLGTKTELLIDDMVGSLPAIKANETSMSLTKAQMAGAAVMESGDKLIGDDGTVLYTITDELAKLGGSTEAKIFQVSMKDLIEKTEIAAGDTVTIEKTSTGGTTTTTSVNRTANANVDLLIIVGDKTTKVEFKVSGTVKYTINTVDWNE